MKKRMVKVDRGTPKGRGFTLIELLIVVAIIAILAAIAVPNFIEAQTRAKVSRVKSDMRSAALALEAYAVDWNMYPSRAGIPRTQVNDPPADRNGINWFTGLTTPVAYINSVDLYDPFAPDGRKNLQVGEPWGTSGCLVFVYCELYRINNNRNYTDVAPSKWVVVSTGPDFRRGPNADGSQASYSTYGREALIPGDVYFKTNTYDSTNGTKSGGDILHWQ